MTFFDQDAPSSGHPISDWADRLLSRLREKRHRRGIRRLHDLDDHILRDIGVTRGEIEAATELPLSVDAATELRRMSLERRRRMM